MWIKVQRKEETQSKYYNKTQLEKFKEISHKGIKQSSSMKNSFAQSNWKLIGFGIKSGAADFSNWQYNNLGLSWLLLQDNTNFSFNFHNIDLRLKEKW